MSKRNEHLIVIMLKPLHLNVEFEVWPQHITIVPWFAVKDSGKLDQILQKVANRHKSFEVSFGGAEEWGKKNKYEVVTIDDSEANLRDLHQDVFDSLEVGGFSVHQKDFLGEKYRPHVVVRNHVQLLEGEPTAGQNILISNFSLIGQVRLKRSGRMIKTLRRDYELKG